MNPRVLVTLGDPRGIGPEVVSKVLSNPPDGADYVVAGPKDLIAELPCEQVAVGEQSSLPLSPVEAGRLVGLQVEKAVALASSGDVDAIVTGPAEKKAFQEAGYRYPGHTEWLGQLAGGVETTMMLVSGKLRVVLITTHVALRDVADSVTRDEILRAARHTDRALRDWWGLQDPRIALCALNPHVGDGGLFGVEDDEVLEPAAREAGVTGPLPADTVFVKALRGDFDAVLVPYHDVGMTAVKMAGFGSGVNVTLGLPFIRTAPDHGTALDIAGRGIADPGSMWQAVALANELAQLRLG